MSRHPPAGHAALLLGILLIGCRAAPPKATPLPCKAPQQNMTDVVAAINANSRLVPTLWARHDFEATIVDEKGKGHFVNGDGTLLYRKPQELLLRGNKDVAGRIFEIGSVNDRYWLSIVPEMNAQWWGRYEHLGKPCVQDIPIRPDMVLEVLGLAQIATDFTRPPVPVMRFNNDACAYMLLWSAPLADRWAAVKEIWYDAADKRPLRVLLFDANGRVVLRANLGRHQPVPVEGQPRELWPVVATDYRLFFPETKSKIAFRLRDVRLTFRGVPREGTIRFPDEPGVERVIQIDRECEQP